MKLTIEDLEEAVDTGTETDQDTWRWGSVHTVVFQKEGKFWQVVYYTQPEMRWADVNNFPIEAVEVEPYQETVTKYRRKT